MFKIDINFSPLTDGVDLLTGGDVLVTKDDGRLRGTIGFGS